MSSNELWRVIIFLICCGLASCTGSERLANSPQGNEHAHVSSVQAALKTWQAEPDRSEHLEALGVVCAEAMDANLQSQELDLLLADTLSNILLRPDLGLPLFEPYLGELKGEQREPYWNALLRNLDLQTLQRELEKHKNTIVNADHELATTLAHQAANFRSMTWKSWLHKLSGAVLYEFAPRKGRRTVNRPIPDWKLFYQTLQDIFPDWNIAFSLASARKTADPDPLITENVTPVAGARMNLLAYQMKTLPLDFARIMEKSGIRDKHRRFTLVLFMESPAGRKLVYCVDGEAFGENPRLIASCSNRFSYILDAIDGIQEGRITGDISKMYQPLVLPY
jgi:hypothetical protein